MANKSRPKQLSFRVNEEEYVRLQRKIEERGKNQQEDILSWVLEKEVVNTDGVKELIPELKRVGNNLNQIAKELNGKGYYSYNLITENQKELNELWQQLKQYLQKSV